MFRSRKSSSPVVSPLEPPPASTRPYPPQSHSQQGSQPQSLSQHRQYQSMNGGLSPQGQYQGQGQGQGQGYFAGHPVDRAKSYDSSTAKSDKGEKRRSGFFGFGKKDKDKHKDKDNDRERERDGRGVDKELPNPRSSFSVERRPDNHHLASPPLPQSQTSNDFRPHQMQQFPPPNPGLSPPQVQHLPSDQRLPNIPQYQGQGPGQRMVSQPFPTSASAGSDFGPYPNPNMPKSQSMGFPQSRSGVSIPETHPYRGFLNAQQEKDQQQQQRPYQGQSQGYAVPRSISGPIDKLQPPIPPANPAITVNGNSGHSTPNTSEHFTGEEGSSGGSTQQPHPTTDAQTPPASANTSTGKGDGPPQPAWQRDFNAVVDLIGSQPSKHYVASPPELEMILARTSAGSQPKQGQPGSATNDWDQVWLQLSGISLSMWSMKETRAAAAKGEKVPPTYFNITDSSLELLAPLPPPPHRPTSHPHHHVFSLNTAGSNRLLFSCPSERDLAKWSSGLRLAAWERARLEEIYTGHLIKAGGQEPASGLMRGRMEGWVRVRVMGGTDWKRLWLVLSMPGGDEQSKEDEKKSRRRSFFGLGDKQPEVVQEPNTGVAMASFYPEPRTPKNRTIPAVLTINNVTQTYAVFPERLEVMSQSNLMKVVGRVNGELVTIEGRLRDSGWALIMPEAPGEVNTSPPAQSPLSNMMRWVTGFHDVFRLYGRPERYNWDKSDPKSLFFAYPEGPNRGQLFLDVDEALMSDFRTTSLPAIREQFVAIAKRKATLPAEQYRDDKDATPRPSGEYRLPPLAFDKPSPNVSDQSIPRSLTPITERTDDASRQNSTRTSKSQPFERRVSDAAPSKQSSGNSLRHPSMTGDEQRLAPITDEGNAPYTDEPEIAPHTLSPVPASVASPAGSAQETVPSSTPSQYGGIDPTRSSTAESRTGVTMWSQDTGTPGISELPPTRSGASTPTTSPHATIQPTASSRTPPAAVMSSREPTRSPSPDVPHPAARMQANGLSNASPGSGNVDCLPGLSTALGLGQPITSPQSSQDSSNPNIHETSNIQSPTPRRVSSVEFSSATGELHEEPAAMYLMNMVEDQPSTQPQVSPPQPSRDERSRPVINTNLDTSSGLHHSLSATRQADVARRPSGARALPPKKTSVGRALVPLEENHSEQNHQQDRNVTEAGTEPQSQANDLPRSATLGDIGQDASAYLAYAEAPSPVKSKAPPPRPVERSPESDELRSSFAPSKAAAERRAKAEAAAAEQERAKTMPGGGKRTAPTPKDTWSGSDEDDDEEEEKDSPVVETRQTLPAPQLVPAVSDRRASYQHPVSQQQQYQDFQPSSAAQPQSAVEPGYDPNRSISRARALPPLPHLQQQQRGSNGDDHREYQSPAGDRRDLHSPAVAVDRPRTQSPAGAPYQQRQSQSFPTGQAQPQQQRQSSYQQQQQQQQHQAQPQPPAPPAQRQTVWNANFSAEHGMPEPSKSGKFVELEEPSVQLTKAFAPHGLLQAGMQDKEDRSAKKQEELARETGSSLINVPQKPPPPQTGLLGAVAAHERDRKNAGGIGATLTDREREKRLAEERGREVEKMQKAQMEQMRQYGGDMYNGQYPYNMGMMGMPPMGYGGYQGGYNPYAQQQAMMAAQMAYQQAMMMSQHGGSQAGGGGGTPDRPASPASHHSHGGGGGGGGYGFPPLPQSMYGWPGMPPWMMGGVPGMGMGTPPPASPGMGMGMGMRMSMPPNMGMGMDPSGGGWLHPNMGGNGGGSGPGTPYDQGQGGRGSRGVSMYSEEGRERERGDHPAN